MLLVLLLPVLCLQRRIPLATLWTVVVLDVASLALLDIDALTVEPFLALVTCNHEPVIGGLNFQTS